MNCHLLFLAVLTVLTEIVNSFTEVFNFEDVVNRPTDGYTVLNDLALCLSYPGVNCYHIKGRFSLV